MNSDGQLRRSAVVDMVCLGRGRQSRFWWLASIFHWLVEWGVGGVVAGVVVAIMPVGCDGLPRVASRRSGLSRGQG